MMSLGDGGEAGFYATTKVAHRISPALNSSSILGISLKHKCQGLREHHGNLPLRLPGVISAAGSVKPSPCLRVWVGGYTGVCCAVLNVPS